VTFASQEVAVPTYISLITFTHQGLTSIKELPTRLDAAREAVRPFGAEIRDVYLTLGRYDLVAAVDAPDDTAAAKAILAIASGANGTSETLRAFREDEYRDIVGSIQPAAEHPAFAAVETVRQKLVESLEELQRTLLRRD
jgi:uncharacterized protein with GYD domain